MAEVRGKKSEKYERFLFKWEIVTAIYFWNLIKFPWLEVDVYFCQYNFAEKGIEFTFYYVY